MKLTIIAAIFATVLAVPLAAETQTYKKGDSSFTVTNMPAGTKLPEGIKQTLYKDGKLPCAAKSYKEEGVTNASGCDYRKRWTAKYLHNSDGLQRYAQDTSEGWYVVRKEADGTLVYENTWK